MLCANLDYRIACYGRISKKSVSVGKEEMTWREKKTQRGETIMNESMPLENQLLVTKFYVPVALGPYLLPS